MRNWLRLFEKQYVGNCKDAFDPDGLCVADELGWNSTDDFDQDQPVEISPEAFRAACPHAWEEHRGVYLRYPSGVYAVYNPETEIYYFYA